MMIAFSVASETRNLKHAYAMCARLQIIAHLLIWTLCLLAIAQGRSRSEDDEDYSDFIQDDLIAPNKRVQRLVNIESLDENCKFDSSMGNGAYRCSAFNFDQPEEVAFFELPTRVRIATDGATYELGEERPLNVLVMENSTFVNFPLHLFYELPLLSELDMRQCGIEKIGWECFLSATNLQILLLSSNEITELDEKSFLFATNLEFLFLNSNKLRSLHQDAFKGLTKLQHLDLSDNQLEQLPDLVFADLAALQHLTLSENRLHFISNELLSHNTLLHYVSLHTNELQTLEEHAFSSATHLVAVDLSHNAPLEVLLLNLSADHLWARNCSLNRVNLYGAVSNLDLRDNRLQELYITTTEALQDLVLRNNSLVHLSTLTHMPRLNHLDVADNPQLGELPDGWQTPQLERLDLSNTGLEQLPLAALGGMPQLRKLNVSANNISEIDPQAFGQLTQLTNFDIHANNWNCFNLRMVMNLLIRNHGISYTVDKYDPDFPGEYINDIACMYRMPEREELLEQSSQQVDGSASVEYSKNSDTTEVEKLRQELKSVVQHFESKLDVVLAQLNNLNTKMRSLEYMNNTLWNQVTITV